MFEQLVESSSGKQRGRWTYFAVTSAIWVLATSAIIIGGVAGYDGRLNDQFKMLAMVLPVLPSAPPLTGAAPVRTSPKSQQQPATFTSQPQTPRDIPQPSSNQPPVDFSQVGGPGSGPFVSGGDHNGVPGGSGINGVPGAPPGISMGEPPPPPPITPKKEETPNVKPPMRHSRVLQGTAIRRVEPLYPRLALGAGVRGSVVVEVVVDEKGNVISARALSGHVLLKAAAENAARGWRWNPTLLNDVAVQVVGTITFNFVK